MLPLGELLRDKTSDQLWRGANFIAMHEGRDYEAGDYRCIPISPGVVIRLRVVFGGAPIVL